MTWPIDLALPLPPSKNALYARGLRLTKKGVPYRGPTLSADYQEFKLRVNQAVAAQTTEVQLARLQACPKLAISILVRFGDRRRHDAANLVDALLDSLKDPLGVDDERFWLVGVKRQELPDKPPCSVAIWPIGEEV